VRSDFLSLGLGRAQRLGAFPEHLAAELAATFETRTLANWLDHFGDEDVCVGPVWSREEAAAAFGSGETPTAVPLGAHTDAWRRELGVD